MGLFDKAFGSGGWLNNMTRAADGNRVVTYTRGATSISVSAVLGKVAFQSIPEGGIRVELGDRDYLIRVADLTLGEPLIGDRITDAGQLWELQPIDNGEPPWRFSDPEETEYRLHVKRIDQG